MTDNTALQAFSKSSSRNRDRVARTSKAYLGLVRDAEPGETVLLLLQPRVSSERAEIGSPCLRQLWSAYARAQHLCWTAYVLHLCSQRRTRFVADTCGSSKQELDEYAISQTRLNCCLTTKRVRGFDAAINASDLVELGIHLNWSTDKVVVSKLCRRIHIQQLVFCVPILFSH